MNRRRLRLVQKLNLPSSFFYDLDLQFSQSEAQGTRTDHDGGVVGLESLRFDFDGDGTLNREETSCMVKRCLVAFVVRTLISYDIMLVPLRERHDMP